LFESPDLDTQPVKRFDRAMRYIYDIKFGMLQVRQEWDFTAQMLW